MANEHRVSQQSLMARLTSVGTEHRVSQQSLMVRISTIDEVLPTPIGEGGFVVAHHWATFKEPSA